MVHIESPSGLHVQSTDPCKIVSQSPSGLVLPWRKIHFLTVLEAKSKIEEPANSAPVKTDSLPGLQMATFSLCPHVAEKANSGLSLSFYFLWSHHTACGILVPQPGTKPGPLAVKSGES